MSKISLITKIEILAQGKFPNWIPAGEIELFSINQGYLATHGGRRARDLVAQGKLERVKDGVSVKYRWNPNYSPPEEKENQYPKKLTSHPIQMEIVDRINSLSPFRAAKKETKIEQTLFL